jgi:hypothetical protein
MDHAVAAMHDGRSLPSPWTPSAVPRLHQRPRHRGRLKPEQVRRYRVILVIFTVLRLFLPELCNETQKLTDHAVRPSIAELEENVTRYPAILFAVPNFKIQVPDELVSGPITMKTSSAVLSTKLN